MKLYNQADFDQNSMQKKQMTNRTLLMMLPCLAASVAGFVLRIEPLCTGGIILAGAILIFFWDLWIAPAYRYGTHLKEVHSGLTRDTLGTFVRFSGDLVYQDGVDFHEMILNIYEDMSEEGERRFLVDAGKEIPGDWLGKDVMVKSHGSFVLEAMVVNA